MQITRRFFLALAFSLTLFAAVRTYRWRPDTCACIIIETHDDVAQTWSGVPVSKCPAHAAVADNALYGVIQANTNSEGKRKNLVEKLLKETGSFGLTQLGPSGTVEFKPGIVFSWQFTGSGESRVLEISVVGVTLTTAQKNQVRTYCDTNFGVGKVVVN